MTTMKSRAQLAAQAVDPATYGLDVPLAPIVPRRKPRYEPVRPPRSWVPIINAVCLEHRVHRRDMLNGVRNRHITPARQHLWWALREQGESYTAIGKNTGGFDHASVLHGVRQWAKKGK